VQASDPHPHPFGPLDRLCHTIISGARRRKGPIMKRMVRYKLKVDRVAEN